MEHRAHLSSEERDARSRLKRLLQSTPFVRGSLVSMARKCGKVECKCIQGDKHVSLYLAVRVGKKRKMIYVPTSLEGSVRTWVETYQEIDQLFERISESCLGRFLKVKQEPDEK